MSVKQISSNKAAIRRLHEAMNANDPEIVTQTIDELVVPDVAFHAPVPSGQSGVQALKVVMATLRRAFPDLHVAIEDMIAEGDKVVTRNTVTGTHLGDYMALAPTGRPVKYDEIFICRFADGQIAEIRGVVGVLSQLKQLGVISA